MEFRRVLFRSTASPPALPAPPCPGSRSPASRHYELPMTQEQLADALALTSVHVNRTLKNLDADGLIVRTRRAVRIPYWTKLAEIADFDSLYLHLERRLIAQA